MDHHFFWSLCRQESLFSLESEPLSILKFCRWESAWGNNFLQMSDSCGSQCGWQCLYHCPTPTDLQELTPNFISKTNKCKHPSTVPHGHLILFTGYLLTSTLLMHDSSYSRHTWVNMFEKNHKSKFMGEKNQKYLFIKKVGWPILHKWKSHFWASAWKQEKRKILK